MQDHQIIRFQRGLEDGAQARALLDAAGKDYLKDMAEIEAKSEEQRQYAADARVRVLANLWTHLTGDYKNAEFANVIIRAANRHTDARWWIDHDPQRSPHITRCLDDDIEDEL